jgi:hypothetical protein
MIIYAAQKQLAPPSQLLSRIRTTLYQSGQSGFANHERIVELLIEFGGLEAAVADALCPAIDSDSPIAQAFRQVSLWLGHSLYHSWKRREGEVKPWLDKVSRALAGLASLASPELVQ